MSITFNPLKLLPHGIHRNVEALMAKHASKLPVVKAVAVALGALTLSVKIYDILKKMAEERTRPIEKKNELLLTPLIDAGVEIEGQINVVTNHNESDFSNLKGIMTTAIDKYITAYNKYTLFLDFLNSADGKISPKADIDALPNVSWGSDWLVKFHSNVNKLISAFVTREFTRLGTSETSIQFLYPFFEGVQIETITSLDTQNPLDQLKLTIVYSHINRHDEKASFSTLIETANRINENHTIGPNADLTQEILEQKKNTLLRLYKIQKGIRPVPEEIYNFRGMFHPDTLTRYLESVKASIERDFS